MKINKTFKKSISVLLTVIMILSTFGAAIIPAGAADTTYYFWNSGTTNSNNIAGFTKTVMTANGDGTYYCDLLVNAGGNFYFTINTNSSKANDDSTIVWSSSSEVTSNITFTSDVKKTNFFNQSYNADSTTYNFPGMSVSQDQTLRFTYTASTEKMVVSVPGSTEETTAPTTTPSSSTWYVTGRFAINGGGHTGSYVGAWDATSENIQLADTDGDGIYTIDTGYTEAELSTHSNWYIRLYDGTNQYGPSTDTPMDKGEKYSLTKDSGQSFQVVNKTGTTGTVKLCLDTINSKFYYTVDSGETSEEDGDYTIEDVTPVNGSLSFKADGKTAGTADAGNTVTITVNPNTAFSLNEITAVYKDANGDEQELTVTDNQFTMPAFNVEVSATFTIDKDAYIADQGDGLWFDAAPSVTDTSATLVKWNNYTSSNHTTSGNPYTLYIPSDVSLSSVVLYNGYDSDLTINGKSIPANDHATVSLAETTYTTSGATSKSVKVMHGSSSSMYFHTTKDSVDYPLPSATGDSRATTSKGSISANGGTCVTIDGASISDSMVIDSVKGRGNSSWKASKQLFGKYAYNMKLDSATKLFNLPKSKSYCLLANNVDESMLRNALTYSLANKVGLYDSPEFRFVDMYDNGEYHGTYFVCEKVDVGDKKLIPGESFDKINEKAIGEDVIDAAADEAAEDNSKYGTSTLTVPSGTITTRYLKTIDDTTGVPYDTQGTYLLEFEIEDRYTDEASWFISPKGQEVVVKSPEYATKEQVEYIAKKFAAMEAVVYESGSSLNDMKNHIDADSFAKMYLIQELSSNLDSAATSYYITFDCSKGTDARFVASPVWDYDWAYSQYTNNAGAGLAKYDADGKEIEADDYDSWYAKNKSMGNSENSSVRVRNLQAELASHSAFQPVIKKVWNGTGLGDGNGFYDKVKYYYNTQIDAWHSQIADSMEMNEYRWGFIENDNASGWGSKDTGDTLQAGVNFLKTWITNRSAWLDGEFAKYTNYSQNATPTLTAYADDGTTILGSEVQQGTAYVLKATTTETYVTYKLYDGNTEVTSNTTGVFTISDATVGVHSYTVKTVTHSGNEMTSDEVEVNVLSTGPVEVPNVLNMEEAVAKTALENAGFKVIVTTESSETVKAGLVISSDPEGGSTVEYGSEVTIVVSTGPVVENPTVPNVVGKAQDVATSELEALGFVVEVKTANSDTVASGNVISSNPKAGTELETGSTVTITVSLGSVPKEDISNVTIMFKGTNLNSLTPEFYFNDEKQADFAKLSKADKGYIGTYYTGAYGFYWWSVTLDEVTVGEDNVLRFKTTGSDMDATLTYDFAGCKSGDTLYFAVNNMYNGTELVDITDNGNAQITYRSAGNMISNENYAEDPTLVRVAKALLDGTGIATTASYSVGDANGDGKINIKDATTTQMMVAGYTEETYAKSVLGDFDLSGDVNIKDTTGIQSYIVNK